MDLKELYYKGFVVGPTESLQAFQERVERVFSYKQTPSLLKEKLPFPIVTWEESGSSFLLFRSNKQLPVWLGALTWIVDAIPVLQLPKTKRFSWISEEELLRHEEVHARRAAFEENRFEEILAYNTSSSPWRKKWGALFRTPRESTIFLALFLLPLFSLWFYLLPLSYLFYLTLRLIKNRSYYKKALQEISILFTSPEKVLECLQDHEILAFAKGKGETVPKNSLRWQQIFLLFKRIN